MPDFKAVIKKLAQEMGFDKVGITHPALLEEGERALESWVHEGRHGSMKYLENFSKRKQRFYEGMPDAKSVIVLGVNYYSKNEIASSASPPRNDSEVVIASERSERSNLAFKGRVARYAWGKDYHEVIRKKHESFIRQLKKNLGKDFRAVSCVDTQPIPERFAAVQAGFGFIGKHTVLLNQKFGPWFFLSEIVTNLELEEDINHEEGNCGTCNHCQTVCPTGALDKDYEIDARRCIAYLTIEHKGVIDRALRPFVKDWIFGCDECL
ncbi:MAG: tRNA epoxyqueuosine(34) reductase QueG, partial [Candidatus Omnitrophica bacterium]|nr:tRNA epoxyqueuosine(34) reductase QueG [Candidatus Omnitrophota bacterium]